MKNIFSWLIVLVWLIIIFLLSNMPQKESSDKSRLLLDTSINIINKINNNNLINNKYIVNKLHKPFRKLMHIFVYFILSILLLIALNKYKKYNIYLITIILCILYATSDEYHQTIVLDRCGRLLDVLIDSIGIFMGCIIYYIHSYIKSLHKL